MAPLAVQRRIPRATYRLQFTPTFGLADAEAIIDYLADLGISDIYASPLLRARPGSQHGYDVVDPSQFNPELGGHAAFERFADSLARRGMGLLLDIVPNHMAAHPENPWWWDVLARGQSSPHADWFDIDWPRGGGKVILPVLGAAPDEVLAKAEIDIAIEQGLPELRYFEQRFPISASTRGLARCAAGDRSLLPGVLAGQHYELIYWRDGPARINYRRFFDISELIAVRPEHPQAFAEMHRLLEEQIRAGRIAGLRIDHIDGLADPQAYLQQLQQLAAGADRSGDHVPAFCLLVEKILAPEERLPESWPVCGTTGYDTLNILGDLWIQPEGAREIFADARRRLGIGASFDDDAFAAKQEVLQRLFPGDLRALAQRLVNAGPFADPAAAEQAIAALTAALPVYRTYIREAPSEQDRRHLAAATAFLEQQRVPPQVLQNTRALVAYLLEGEPTPARGDFLRRWQQFTGPIMAKGVEDTAMYRHIALVCLNEVGGHPAVRDDAIARFHQVCRTILQAHPHRLNATSTHDTKRSEDVRCRIAVLSECAGEWLAAAQRWTAHNARHAQPHQGARAPSPRDEVLLYQTLLGAWPTLQDAAAADQGIDESFIARIKAYMLKAAREAKLQTSWTDPDGHYESALHRFIEAILADEHFRRECAAFAQRLSPYGALNSLSQTLLKLTMPGVPDLYQGSELWDLSLVDPDNRRPIDFSQRRAMLARSSPADFPETLAHWRDGSPKLALTSNLLRLRRQHPDLFDRGEYIPLPAAGPQAGHIIAFIRRSGEQWLLVAAGRLLMPIYPEPFAPGGEAWSGTMLALPPGSPAHWHSVLSGDDLTLDAPLDLARIFAAAPLAVLISAPHRR